jgi:hypothetical protein
VAAVESSAAATGPEAADVSGMAGQPEAGPNPNAVAPAQLTAPSQVALVPDHLLASNPDLAERLLLESLVCEVSNCAGTQPLAMPGVGVVDSTTGDGGHTKVPPGHRSVSWTGAGSHFHGARSTGSGGVSYGPSPFPELDAFVEQAARAQVRQCSCFIHAHTKHLRLDTTHATWARLLLLPCQDADLLTDCLPQDVIHVC